MSDVKISQFPYVGNTGYTPTDLLVFVNYLNPTGTTSNTKIDDVKDYVILDSYNYFLPLSGGTVTGSTTFTNGLTSNTISATTYQNLPIDPDTYVTGFTYNNNVFTIKQNNNQSDITADINSVTGWTVNGDLTVTGNSLVKDLSATTISAITYQNLPQDIFVTGGTYTNGEILFKNNSGGSFTVTGLPIGGAGGQVYYLNLSQTQTPYQEFSPIGTNLTEQTTGVTINSGVTSTIASFLTPVGYPNTTTIPAGYWSFYLHSFKDVVNASFDIFCEVYTYTTGGTETLILTTEGADVTTYSPTVSMELTDGYYSGGTIDITDRILVKVRTTNNGSQTNTLSFFTEGQQHYSYGITPFSNFNALTCETLSGCTTIVNLENNKVNKSGDTMTGTLNVPTISATTYQNLPIDPNTFVTGFTYSDNTFTIKQNNGQPDLSQTINTVTGLTVNGNLNITGNTSTQGLTATTFSSSTVNVGNTTGTPNQAASFDSSGKLVAGLGQTTYKLYGNASLPLSNATTAYFVVPGLSQTFTVPSNCSVYVFSTGGIGNTNGSSYTFTSYVGIFVDGSLQTDGGFNHINTMNPNTINVAFTNTTWSLSSILNLSVGSHTVDIRARYVNTSNAGQGAAVSGVSGNSRQGELYIIIIKN